MNRINAHALEGLSRDQAAKRFDEGYNNAQPRAITKPLGRILREHICTFFNLLNLLILISLLLVESYTNIAFMGVVTSNLIIGVAQEIRSKKTVEKLSLMHANTCRVIRSGEELRLALDKIVLDDIVRLGLGDQAPTDCIVLQGAAEVDESLLTGESNALLKLAGDELLSGSVIVSGGCYARVERVGANSYANALTLEASKPKRIDSSLMRSMRLIIRFAGGAVLPLGLLMFARALMMQAHTLKSAVDQAAASMIGMIPSGLMLLTSVSLALGVITLSRKKTLVQENYAIETLARVDMLCLDKTGTLTTGDMRVMLLCPLDGAQAQDIEDMLADFVSSLPADNATSRALDERFKRKGASIAKAVTHFSSQRKYSAAAFDSYTLYVGAPDYVCAQMSQSLRADIAGYSAQGCRVVMLAIGSAAKGEPPQPAIAAPKPAALLLLMDEIRPDAAQTLRFFNAEGVSVKLISGDDPLTVAHIARRLELEGHDSFIDVSKLLDDRAVEAAALSHTVFGRVSPYQKRILLSALKKAGHTVAMTGDGVNDLLALREADCSIALYTGSDAARQASHMVLLTNDFSALPSVVMEGRRVINNITRMASLFLVKTIYSLLLTVSAVLLDMAYPFSPVQLSLISALTVGVPSFFLAMEPNRTRIKGSFLKNVISQALPGAVCIFLYAVVAGVVGHRHGLLYPQINTLCVYLTGTAGLCVLLRVCQPLVRWRALLWFGMAALFFIAARQLHWLLGIIVPEGQTMIIMYCIMALSCYPLLLILQGLIKKLLRVEK